jgi:two-component system, chemotaxis family, chemotaxis protein CheY
VRDTLRQYLAGGGHEVLEAENGVQGLEVFKVSGAELVISDVHMPSKEGISTLIEIRQLNPQTKIIMMSGGGRSGSTDYLDLARQLGAAATFRKPFRKALILEIVDRVLKDQAPR